SEGHSQRAGEKAARAIYELRNVDEVVFGVWERPRLFFLDLQLVAGYQVLKTRVINRHALVNLPSETAVHLFQTFAQGLAAAKADNLLGRKRQVCEPRVVQKRAHVGQGVAEPEVDPPPVDRQHLGVGQLAQEELVVSVNARAELALHLGIKPVA